MQPLIISTFFYILLFQTELPYKPKDEFEVRMNYELKEKPSDYNGNTVEFVEAKRKPSNAPLPYLTLQIKLIKLPNKEVKIKALDHTGRGVLTKKIVEGDIVKMVLGFTDDMKDRVTSHEYNLIMIGTDKKEVNRIHLYVGEDGIFKVNGELKGKL